VSVVLNLLTNYSYVLYSVRICHAIVKRDSHSHSLQLPEQLKHRLLKELAMEDPDLLSSIQTCPPAINTHLAPATTHQDFLAEMKHSNLEKASLVLDGSIKSQADNAFIAKLNKDRDLLRSELPHLSLRVKNGTYVATNHYQEDPETAKQYDPVQDEEQVDGPRRAKQKINTVASSGVFLQCLRKLKQFLTTGKIQDFAQDTTIIENINLIFEPGRMVLVLGGPGSGKSSILRLIANVLPKGKDFHQSGQVTLSGICPTDKTPDGKPFYWPSLVGFMDQIDRLHPYLTVFETCEFAWKCRMGGTHRRPWMGTGPDIDRRIAELDAEKSMVHLVLEAVGLFRVKDTFVGDQENVRGVSGGERRRVTVAEMLCIGVPVLCCDEISTGLDAATTFDITLLFGLAARIFNRVTIVSLLQPPPETVANFDDLVVVSEGKVIYAGPLEGVINYFNGLGYEIPTRMDTADWLQALPTQEGLRFMKSEPGAEPQRHLTPKEFSDRFYASPLGLDILKRLEEPEKATDSDKAIIFAQGAVEFANGAFASAKLLAQRELLLWWRDKYQVNMSYW
jgi:ABC-type multidrug transport system ATPase subunit